MARQLAWHPKTQVRTECIVHNPSWINLALAIIEELFIGILWLRNSKVKITYSICLTFNNKNSLGFRTF